MLTINKSHVFAFSLLALALQSAQAACTFSPTAGNDTFVCDSGSATSLVDLLGNNSLTFAATSTGSINGPVTFGSGTDSINIGAGLITGAVDQGNGIDDFVMSGGQIQSLAQGDGRDIDGRWQRHKPACQSDRKRALVHPQNGWRAGH